MNDIVDRLRETAECADYVVDRETAAEAVAEISKLRAALELWHLAVRIDATMEGPVYMGVSSTLGRKAWEQTRAALTAQPAEGEK